MRPVTDLSTWKSVNLAAYERMASDYFRRSDGAGIEIDALRFVSMLIERFGSMPVILDAGSGPGIDAWRINDAGGQLICLDISVRMLWAANERCAPAALVCGDMLSTPFRSHSFHGVWASASLFHVPRPALTEALGEICRLLVKDGILYLSLRAGEGQVSVNPGTGCARLLCLYQEDGLESVLLEAGLCPLTLDRRKWPRSLNDGVWIHGFAIRR